MIITWQIRLALYAVAAIGIAGLVWYADHALKTHYQKPVLEKLEKAESDRDGWKANAENAEKKRAELNKKLLARDVFDRTVRAQIEQVASDLEQLKNQKPEVRTWADTVIPTDVIRLRLDETTKATPAPSVQGGRSPQAEGGSSGTSDERGDESSNVESYAGAGRRVSDV
jgi:hypothetical protein